LLHPFKTSFAAPDGVALYLFCDGSWVIENLNDEAVTVELNHKQQSVPGRGWKMRWQE